MIAKDYYSGFGWTVFATEKYPAINLHNTERKDFDAIDAPAKSGETENGPYWTKSIDVHGVTVTFFTVEPPTLPVDIDPASEALIDATARERVHYDASTFGVTRESLHWYSQLPRLSPDEQAEQDRRQEALLREIWGTW